MRTREKTTRDIVPFLENQHRDVLSQIDQLTSALQGLHYEGKASLGKNIKEVEKALVFFHKELLPHIVLDEEIIFPFLEKHIPKLQPMLSFLKAEHSEFAESLHSFEKIFRRLQEEPGEQKSRAIIEQLREKGIYLNCLIRNHIHTESEGVYRAIDEDLKKEEKRQLLEAIG